MSGWVAGAVVVGGVLASEGAKDAAQTQAGATESGIAEQRRATEAALAEQRRQYDTTRADYAQTRADYAPYREAGTRALGGLESAINQPFGGAEALAEPGYAFGLQQGQQALDRKAAAAGGRVSGAALKSAAEYATNYATTGYNAAYQRRQDRLNRLAALAGIGQSATGSSAAAGAGAGASSNISNLLSGQGNAIAGMLGSQGDAAAAGQLAQGNIWGNVANQIGAAGQRWANTPSTSMPTSPYTGYTGDYNALAYQP